MLPEIETVQLGGPGLSAQVPSRSLFRGKSLPLSFAQKRLWVLERLEPGNPAYNISATICVNGRLEWSSLQQSLAEIVRRHETLRTVFISQDGQPVQRIDSSATLTLPVIDLQRWPVHEREAQAWHLIREQARRPFDLTQAPLLRAELFQLADTTHILCLTLHRMIADRGSVDMLITELALLYESFFTGRPVSLPELPIQYADLAVWQQQLEQSEDWQIDLAYWKKQLSQAPTALDLPTDYARPPQQTFRGARQPLRLSPALSKALKALAQQTGVTLFVTLLAAFKVLLQRHTGQTNIVVGTLVANRQRPELQGLLGCLANTLALRTDLAGNPTFFELLQRVNETTSGAQRHQALPFEKLVEELKPIRDLSRTPFFQVMFLLQETPLKSVELPGLTLASDEVDNETTQFDLTLSLQDTAQGLSGTLAYNTDLFEAATMERLAGQLKTLLEGIVISPELPLADLPLLTDAERHQLLTKWNETQLDTPAAQCLHHLFEAQVERTADAVALIFDAPATGGEGVSHHVTYEELDRRANQLAHYLQQLGVGPEVLIGVCLERSLEMIIGLLAILKAGSAYVPLDPAYPPERIAFMLADAAAPVVLTQRHLLSRLSDSNTQMLCLDTDWGVVAQCSEAALDTRVIPTNLAYIIYTSGSTGRPKGVAIAHHNAVVLLNWAAAIFSPADLRGVLASTSICFDLSVYELFLPLSRGGTIILAENALRLPTLLSREAVTLINTVPSAITELAHNEAIPDSVCTVNLAGEPLKRKLVQEVYAQARVRSVYNLYGPSEDTTYSTFTRIDRDDLREPSIGKPISNTQAYILDARLQPVPIGVVGELYLGGQGLSRGYLNRPDLTAERYIPNPFARIESVGRGDGDISAASSLRLYRTGDLARYRPDGNIEFLGRIDHQVKIRGFRIELGEIESVLSRHPNISSVVVISQEGVSSSPADKRLVAYFVAEREPAPTLSELRSYVQKALPDYMVPSAFVRLAAMPLTPNGKLDRRALPAPTAERPELADAFAAPRTAVEQVLASTWEDVLGLKAIGLHDNFFELGAHSLLATQVISRIRQIFHTEISLSAFFERPTLADLAQYLETARQVEEPAALALRPLAGDTPAPLSLAQQQLWFLDQFVPGSALYNVPVVFHLVGDLDTAVLEQCLNEIVQRHAALRTTFTAIEGQPLQIVSPAQAIPLTVIDLLSLPQPDREQYARRLMHEQARQLFDLATGPLLQVTLIRIEDQECYLLWVVHHIVFDGWSTGVLMREIGDLYQLLATGQPASFPALPLQYVDFACWQSQALPTTILEKHQSYWQTQLQDAPFLALPTDHPRPAAQTFCGARLSSVLSASLITALENLSRQENASLFMILLAAFQTLLSRYSNQTDVVVGTPVANRNQRELEGLIGLFVNILPLRVELAGNLTFRDLIKKVRQIALEAYAHQDLPLNKIIETQTVERDLRHNAIVQVVLAVQNIPVRSIQLPDIRLSFVEELGTDTAKFDLTLFIEFPEQGPIMIAEYNTDLFDEATIARLLLHFQILLANVAADPDQRLSAVGLLSEAERHQLLVGWNAPQGAYPRESCVHELFERQVAQTPEAVAVVCEEYHLTYEVLNRRANQLGHYLRKQGVGAETLVGLSVERSVEMIIGLLGILKAGGAYLPLDPAYPAKRLALMLEEGRVPVLLTQATLLGGLPPHQARVLCLDSEWPQVAHESEATPANGTSAQNLAYVMYTSGSTGRPKGISIVQRSIIRLVRETNYAHFGAEEIFLQFAPLAFDASTLEVWGAILNGGRLVVFPAGTPSLEELGGVLQREAVTTLWLTAGLFHQMVDHRLADLRGVRQLLAGGDVLSVAQVLHVRQELPGVRLINGYGPTENTTFTSCYSVAGAELIAGTVPIGRPIAHTRVYVLDRELQPVPLGVAGELYVSGDGLARGYLNRPDLTAERFIPNPFAHAEDAEPGDEGTVAASALRLYKTGDLVRYRPDGNLEFLGRMDQQVKIRGFRIELGEIETVLSQHPAVREAVVVVREERAGDKRLVAYVGLEPGATPTVAELRHYLREKLPEHMLPAACVLLETLPLNPNGKVDRQALLALTPNQPLSIQDYVAPRSPTEEILVSLWRTVLRLDQIGVYDNFFELGGHSLLATQIVSRVRAAFQVELRLQALFEAPTIAGLAKRIETAARADHRPLLIPVKGPDQDGALPLSYGQQQLWLIDQLAPGNFAYNSPFSLQLAGPLDIVALQQSLNEIVRRHQMLRTTFATSEGQPAQRIAPAREQPLPIIDLGQLPDSELQIVARQLAHAEAQRSFDLSTGPLFRTTLLRLAEDKHCLLLIMHHIVVDGWSVGVLFDELGRLYRAFSTQQPSPLPELAIQYADYASWQRTWLQGVELEQRLAYWKQRLAGTPTLVGFPLDRPRPSALTFQGGHQSLSFSRPFTAKLKALSQQIGVTLFMTLLAALKTLIYRYTDQTDMVVGTVIANRHQPEVENLIGYFINVLALRTQLADDLTFRQLLERVRETTLGAYAHQEVPFEKLVEVIQLKRDLSYNPFFQVMFILQNTFTAAPVMPGLSVTVATIDTGTVQFVDLHLELEETEQGLKGFIKYNIDLFDHTTVRQIQADYQTLLESVTADPDQAISTLLPLVKPRPQQFMEVVQPPELAEDTSDDMALQKTNLLKRRAKLTAEKQSRLQKRLRGV